MGPGFEHKHFNFRNHVILALYICFTTDFVILLKHSPYDYGELQQVSDVLGKENADIKINTLYSLILRSEHNMYDVLSFLQDSSTFIEDLLLSRVWAGYQELLPIGASNLVQGRQLQCVQGFREPLWPSSPVSFHSTLWGHYRIIFLGSDASSEIPQHRSPVRCYQLIGFNTWNETCLLPLCSERQIWSNIWARVRTQGDPRVLGLVLKDHLIWSSHFSNREIKAQTKIMRQNWVENSGPPSPFYQTTICSLCLSCSQQWSRGSQT